MRSFRSAFHVGCALLALAAPGCGSNSGPTLYPVEGTVSYEGKPIANGQIILIPAEAGGTPDAGAIKDGHFALKSRAGKKKVQIEASREVPGKTQPDPVTGTRPLTEMFIPARYNKNSELSVDVIAGSNPPVTLDLASDKK